jgi:signal transduction histidine kinase
LHCKIARDLHDHLGARLTLVQHLTEALDHRSSSNGNGALPRQKLSELARELNASLDSAVWAVQPDKDTLASLTDYLGDTFQELLGGTDIELELDFPEPLPAWPLSRAERYHLALIAVEALNNVLKHAHATIVQLRLEIAGDRFTFRIRDNGCGFIHKAHTNGYGNGLSNMRERIHRLGGQFEVVTAPGKGTTALITLVPSALRQTP